MFSRFLQNTLGYPFTENDPEMKEEQTVVKGDLLPTQLVGRILELQMQCEEATASPQLVSQLISLYAEAFDFYEKRSSPKSSIYQKRMRLFLSKHSIESLLKGHKGHLIAKREMVERKKQHAVYGTKEAVKRIIDHSQKKAQKNNVLLKKEINGQQKALEDRIQRRKSMSNRSTKTTEHEDLCEDLFMMKGVQLPGYLVMEGLHQRSSKKVYF